MQLECREPLVPDPKTRAGSTGRGRESLSPAQQLTRLGFVSLGDFVVGVDACLKILARFHASMHVCTHVRPHLRASAQPNQSTNRSLQGN